MRRIFHLDLDAFFVAVERLSDPSLQGVPVIVGGDPQGRGVVACASYEARPYGVRAGMPLRQAYRLCPHARFLQGSFDRYLEVSQRFMELLEEYTPFVQPMGLDEAYLDMTGFESMYGPLRGAAHTIKARVRNELGVVVSVGIASSKVTAKVASDAGKPDGFLEVPAGRDAEFLAPLPVEQLPGVGEKTAPRLKELGIATIGQLAQTPAVTLRSGFGAWGDLLARWARGEDDSPVLPAGDPKSISRETTFAHDTLDLPFLLGTLRYLSERVCGELRQQRKLARCVVLKLRWDDFTTLSRHHTLKRPSNTDEAVFAAWMDLFLKELRQEVAGQNRKVRLLGIGVAELQDAVPQLSFLDQERPQGLARALDAIREKYGYTSVQRGLTLQLRNAFPEGHGRYLLKTACLSR
ncbi:MAG: DNA polymerase IV [Chloroflexi bacterium]|nr:DNA polymerase IV [Chloroflexota bacterium]